MIPIEFFEQTRVLRKPAGMTDEEYSSLPIWLSGKHPFEMVRKHG
jgi:hypothetical protein